MALAADALEELEDEPELTELEPGGAELEELELREDEDSLGSGSTHELAGEAEKEEDDDDDMATEGESREGFRERCRAGV